MASSAERIAVEVTSRADPSGVRQMREETTSLGKATVVSAESMSRALKETGGDLKAAAALAAQWAQQTEQVVAVSTRAAIAGTAQAKAIENVELQVRKLPPSLRTAANASALLIQSFESGKGSAAGMAVAAGNVATTIAMLSSSVRIAAAATGIGALITVLTVIIELMNKADQKANDLLQRGLQQGAQVGRQLDLLAAGRLLEERYGGEGPFAVREKGETDAQFLARAQGVAGLERRLAEIRAEADRLNAQIAAREAPGGDRTKGAGAYGRIAALSQEQAQLNQALATQQQLRVQAQKAFDAAVAKEADTAANALEAQRDKASKKLETKEDREREQSLKRATDLQVQLTNIALEAEAKRRGGDEALARQRIEDQYQNQLREIAALKVGEDKKTELIALATRARNDQIAGINQDYRDQEARKREEAARKEEEENDQQVAREQAKIDASLKMTQRFIASSIDASIRAHQSLIGVLTRAMLEPIVHRLEGLAASELVEAGIEAAFLNFAGAARHLAMAGLAAAGAAKVASIGGLSSSAGGGGAGGGGTFTPRGNGGGGGDVHLTIQTIDPRAGSVIEETIYHINRSEILKRPIVPPPQRRSA
jgi:hypothetical protein